jgi:hypothetical protein
MFGTITKWRAKKLVAQVAASGAGGKIIFVGDKLDLPSFLRASFAAVSLGSHSERLLKAAVAMARPTVWTDNEFGIRPNIMMESASAEDIARALDAALGLSEQRRAEYEKRNLADAQSFSIEKIADDFLNGG